MTGNRDRDLVEGIRAGRALGIVAAEDPGAVVAEVTQDPGTVLVDAELLPCAVAGARVRIAEVVVDRARRVMDRAATEPPVITPPEHPGDVDHVSADRQAVRFALWILLLALPAGIAVYVVDGVWLAPVLPSAALLALGVVVLVHRRPSPPPAVAPDEVGPVVPPPDVEASPSVRAARAHLRRQQAAWKVAWWERELAVPDLDAWSVRLPVTAPITLVALDAASKVDGDALAVMTASAPAAVRVVVVRSA